MREAQDSGRVRVYASYGSAVAEGAEIAKREGVRHFIHDEFEEP